MPNYMQYLPTSLLAAGVMLVGCGSSESGDDAGESTSATSGAGGASAAASTGDVLTTSSTTSSVSAGVGGQGGPGTSTSTVGVGGSSPGGPCDPAAADTMCEGCIKTSCCTEAQACFMDTKCTCTVDCVEKGGDDFDCADGCDNILPNDVTNAFSACVDGSCAAPCAMP